MLPILGVPIPGAWIRQNVGAGYVKWPRERPGTSENLPESRSIPIGVVLVSGPEEGNANAPSFVEGLG